MPTVCVPVQGWPTGTTWQDYEATVDTLVDSLVDHFGGSSDRRTQLRSWQTTVKSRRTETRFAGLSESGKDGVLDTLKIMFHAVYKWPLDDPHPLPLVSSSLVVSWIWLC